MFERDELGVDGAEVEFEFLGGSCWRGWRFGWEGEFGWFEDRAR